MADARWVPEALQDFYGVDLRDARSMAQYAYDHRDIYRVETAEGRAFVLRVLREQEEPQGFARLASVLTWLERQGIDAPRVVPTARGESVARWSGWWLLLASFVPGEVLSPDPRSLGLAAETLALLHARGGPADSRAALPLSRWHPDAAASTDLWEMARSPGAVPTLLRTFHDALAADLREASWMHGLPIGLVHGDCWYANAILTPARDVVYVDWEQAGLGAPVLDLVYLLLTSHYDPTDPLCIRPDPARIRAILDGYHRHRQLTDQERRALPRALRWPLVPVGLRCLAAARDRWEEDLPLRKVRARYAACDAIARVAADLSA